MPTAGATRGAILRPRFHVVAYDFGIKRNILRRLVDAGAGSRSSPDLGARDALALKPDGVFLSNGPGDPAAVEGARRRRRRLLGKVPIFGICLGHQILGAGARAAPPTSSSSGTAAPTSRSRTWPRGKVEITSQNHGFAVDVGSLGRTARVSHMNLNDGTVEGIEAQDAPAFSVQYHPEASPGPHDARYLFDRFVEMMEQRK